MLAGVAVVVVVRAAVAAVDAVAIAAGAARVAVAAAAVVAVRANSELRMPLAARRFADAQARGASSNSLTPSIDSNSSCACGSREESGRRTPYT